MSTDFNVRLYQDGDEVKIINLLKRVFGDWPKIDLACTSVDHWNWLYLDNPEKINPTVVAERDGEIIGVNHGLYSKIKVGKNIVLCLKGTDLAVHPDYRRMGVSKKIGEIQQKRNLEFGTYLDYYLTTNPIVIESNVRSGGKVFPHSIKMLVKIQNVGSHLRHTNTAPTFLRVLTLEYGYKVLKWLNNIKNALNSSNIKYPINFSVTKITKFDDRINIFWDKIKNIYYFIVEKNDNYLNWRFCDSRGGDYEVFIAEENNEILGYIVFRTNRYQQDYPIGFIMEVLALPERLDVAEFLIKGAIEYFEVRKINTIQAMIVENHAYERLLSKYGLIDSREKFFVGINQRKEGIDLSDFMNATPDKLHYQYGEGDTI